MLLLLLLLPLDAADVGVCVLVGPLPRGPAIILHYTVVRDFLCHGLGMSVMISGCVLPVEYKIHDLSQSSSWHQSAIFGTAASLPHKEASCLLWEDQSTEVSCCQSFNQGHSHKQIPPRAATAKLQLHSVTQCLTSHHKQGPTAPPPAPFPPSSPLYPKWQPLTPDPCKRQCSRPR